MTREMLKCLEMKTLGPEDREDPTDEVRDATF